MVEVRGGSEFRQKIILILGGGRCGAAAFAKKMIRILGSKMPKETLQRPSLTEQVGRGLTHADVTGNLVSQKIRQTSSIDKVAE